MNPEQADEMGRREQWTKIVEDAEHRADVEVTHARFAEMLKKQPGKVRNNAGTIATLLEENGYDSASMFAALTIDKLKAVLAGELQLGEGHYEKILAKTKLLWEVHLYLEHRTELYEHEISPSKRRGASEERSTPIAAKGDGSAGEDSKPAAEPAEQQLEGAGRVSEASGEVVEAAEQAGGHHDEGDDDANQPRSSQGASKASRLRGADGKFVKTKGGKTNSASPSHVSRSQSVSMAPTEVLDGIPEHEQVSHHAGDMQGQSQHMGQQQSPGGTSQQSGATFNPALNQQGARQSYDAGIKAALHHARAQTTQDLIDADVLTVTSDGHYIAQAENPAAMAHSLVDLAEQNDFLRQHTMEMEEQAAKEKQAWQKEKAEWRQQWPRIQSRCRTITYCARRITGFQG